MSGLIFEINSLTRFDTALRMPGFASPQPDITVGNVPLERREIGVAFLSQDPFSPPPISNPQIEIEKALFSFLEKEKERSPRGWSLAYLEFPGKICLSSDASAETIEKSGRAAARIMEKMRLDLKTVTTILAKDLPSAFLDIDYKRQSLYRVTGREPAIVEMHINVPFLFSQIKRYRAAVRQDYLTIPADNRAYEISKMLTFQEYADPELGNVFKELEHNLLFELQNTVDDEIDLRQIGSGDWGSTTGFEEHFPTAEVKKVLQKLKRDGLVWQQGTVYGLTEQGKNYPLPEPEI